METPAREIHFTLNGRSVTTLIESHLDLIDLLHRYQLSGARESCGQGLCGCCTVMVDGQAVSGCLTLAQLVDGKDVRTVEDLDADGNLSPVQQAFIEEGAFQCGFCTPGFVMTSLALLRENPDPTEDEIRHTLSGNICRCTGYQSIVDGVKRAARAGLGSSAEVVR